MLAPLLITGAFSWILGLIVCGCMAWCKKSFKSIALTAAILFGWPCAVYYGIYLKHWLENRQLKSAISHVEDLCAKYGGDKIYRIVENVEGVFQMVAKHPNTDFLWTDQFGMKEPWAMNFKDQDEYPAASLGVNGGGYWFVEQQPITGTGPPYRRRSLLKSTKRIGEIYFHSKNPDTPIFTEKLTKALELQSRYGYATEDLSTPELRKKWIGGGKLTIYDLDTKEVLAERVGYYKAFGPEAKIRWSGRITCQQNNPADLRDFIKSVLRPPAGYPIN